MTFKILYSILLASLGFVLCTSSVITSKPPLPKFSTNYIVKGVLKLPYAEISEPFVAYYDQENGRSRIDYYGDMVKTYQLAYDSVSYKIAYMPDSKGQPQRTCFQINGTDAAPVEIQSILPDLSSFAYTKDVQRPGCNSIHGKNCEIWYSENSVGNKVNRYTMLLRKGSHEPVHYEMKGYNTLLGSHYDKYEIFYNSFAEGNATEDDFHVETGLKCRDFPGPGVRQMVSINPMLEFINNEHRHIHDAFEDFKTTHKKSYKDDKDHDFRNTIFLQNFRYIDSMNRRGLSYSLEINHLADFSDKEIQRLRGRLPSKGFNGGKPFPEDLPEKIPDFVDWQLFGAVTPVKDQAVCGSCWSFGTTGTIEGTYFLKTKNLVRLSQQQLIDCSWNFQNNGCDGGEDFRAYQYIMEAGGLATEADYGAYLGEDGICHDKNVTKTAIIKGYVNVTSGDANALKKAIAHKGPISVGIDAAHKSLSFYSFGVYYEPECKSGADELDHSVLAVGYGTTEDQDYWIIKNSWSTYWGNDGYVLMSQKDNNCGVTTSPTYVLM